MKKKVLQIGGNLRANGISTFIMTLNRALNDEFEFIYVNTAQEQDVYRAEVERLGGKVYDVCVKGRGFLRALRQARKIRKIIRAERPDAVHSHYWSNNGLYLKQAYKEDVPVRISHCHQAGAQLSLGKKIAKYFSNRMTKKYATHRFACSETARKFIYGQEGEVVYNAIDFEKFHGTKAERAAYGIDENAFCFLFVGRFSKQKNLPFLLDVVAKLQHEDICFLLVGHGDEEEAVKRAIAESALKNVRLLPANSDIAALMSISDGLLLPSLYEGFSIVLLEAQAAGIRCLASDMVPREVQMGLVEYLPLDVSVWCEKVMKLCKSRAPHRPCYLEEFSIPYLSALFEGIYSVISCDEWLARGREYSLGSKRFLRSKALSFACLKRAHLIGDIRGTFHYALAFFEGNGVEKSRTHAKQIAEGVLPEIERRAVHSADYLTLLGDAYSFGLGKEQNYEEAYRLYRKAAEAGNLEAMCDLGYMYLVGQGIPQDKAKSFEWWKRSADMGYVHSMRDVGQSYLNGDGCPMDSEQAVRYFRLASEHNYAHGTADLARCYISGVGVAKDLEEATRLFQVALKQDDERTMRDLFSLGVDILALQKEGTLRFLQNDFIDEIGVQNSYNGTLCVAERIRRIDPKCFYSSEIKKIFVEKENSFFSMRDGVLFDKTGSTLLRFPPKSPVEEYAVPRGVLEIGAHAFQNCRGLKKVVLPDGIKKIHESAFDDCKQMTEINLPESLEEIGAWAFHGCDEMRYFTVPAAVYSIGKYAFGSCESLQGIDVQNENEAYMSRDGVLYNAEQTILLQYPIGRTETFFCVPKSVREIAFRAFSDAYALECVDCGEVRKLDEKSFYYCGNLRTIKIKRGTEIGARAFESCYQDFTLEEQE